MTLREQASWKGGAPMGEKEEQAARKSKRAPFWLRIVLMVLLILFVGFAFYMNNLNIIKRLNE